MMELLQEEVSLFEMEKSIIFLEQAITECRCSQLWLQPRRRLQVCTTPTQETFPIHSAWSG